MTFILDDDDDVLRQFSWCMWKRRSTLLVVISVFESQFIQILIVLNYICNIWFHSNTLDVIRIFLLVLKAFDCLKNTTRD